MKRGPLHERDHAVLSVHLAGLDRRGHAGEDAPRDVDAQGGGA
jgi:hypothetical protein